MALEIQSGVLMSKPSDVSQYDRDEEDSIDDAVEAAVVHNYQHDLESLWWMIFFIAAFYTNHAPSIAFCQRIFLPDITKDRNAMRHAMFRVGYPAAPGLLASLHPELSGTLFKSLNAGRAKFCVAAISRSINAQEDLDSFSFVCVVLLISLFEKAALAKDTWGSIPLVKPQTSLEAEFGRQKLLQDVGPTVDNTLGEQLGSVIEPPASTLDTSSSASRGIKRPLFGDDGGPPNPLSLSVMHGGRSIGAPPRETSIDPETEAQLAKRLRREPRSI